MGNNSIRSNLTKDYIISDLRLSISDDIYKEKVFVVVEGEKDINFFNALLNKQNVVIYESYDGKNGVTEIVNNFFLKNDHVIGIRDRDYTDEEQLLKVYFYDNCCLEMMIVECEDVFESIYSEFYKGNMSSKELYHKILQELCFFSLIRMYNEKYGWGINLKAISIYNMFIKASLSINNKKIVEEINKGTGGTIDKNKLEMIENKREELTLCEELLKITQGHDFSNLFAVFCNMHRRKHISGEVVEIALRCSYRNEDFKHTMLYNKLVEYQRKIGIEIVSTS